MAQRNAYQPNSRQTPPQSPSAGDRGVPGMAMPPAPSRVSAQPAMPIGGKPPAPGGGTPGGMPQNGMPQTPPPIPPFSANPSPGGPMSPMNIGQMLQSQMETQPGGGTPGGGSASAMTPWGDEGTRPQPGPSRVPITGMGIQTAQSVGAPSAPGMDGLPGEHMGAPGGIGSDVLMKLLQSLGRV